MLELLQQYEYVFLFFGVLLGGEVVLLPAVYLVIINVFGLAPLLVIAIVATLITDSFWYIVGRKTPLGQAKNWPLIRRRTDRIAKASEAFRKHGLKFLLISKFVYGTRIITQFLCGAHKLPFFRYLLMDVLGVFIWLGAILAVGLAIGSSLQALDDAVFRIGLFATVFFGLVILLHIWITSWYKRQ